MFQPRRRTARFVSVSTILALLICLSGAADGGFRTRSESIHPVVVTVARSFTGVSTSALDGGDTGCQCSEPDEIARETPENPCVRCAAVCLMPRGLLIAEMSAPFTNGTGVDLLVYEWGDRCRGVDDPFSVYVSENGHQWILVAEEIRNDPGDLRASIELGDLRGSYRFVKIIPGGGSGRREGPEIVAIQAVYPVAGVGVGS
jgi:hypothetical protein